MSKRWERENAYFLKEMLPDGQNHWHRDAEPGEESYKRWLNEVREPGRIIDGKEYEGNFYKGSKEELFDEKGNQLKEPRKVDIEPREMVSAIVRLRDVVGNEWLYSIGNILAFNQFGDERVGKFHSPEVYKEQVFRHETKLDPKDNKWKQMTGGPSHIIMHYTTQFNKKNVMELWDKRALNCELVVKDERNTDKTVPVPNNDLQMFLDKPFDYLYNEEHMSLEQKLARAQAMQKAHDEANRK